MIFDIDDSSRADRPAVIDTVSDESSTYAELAQRVAKCQAALPAGKHLIFVFCHNSLASLSWYLAAFDAGHAVALLDEEMNPAFREKLIAAYRPDVVTTAAGQPGPEYTEASGLWTRRSDDPPHQDLALLLSTSGTTGSPKFVRLTRRNLESNAVAICEALAITGNDRAVSSLPIHYSYGLSVVNTHLLAGGTLVLTSHGLMSTEFWNQVRRHECTSFQGVPYTYRVLRRLDLNLLHVPSLKTLTQAGGKLDDEHVSHFHGLMQQRGGRFFVMYGQTEASPRIAVLPPDRLPEKLGSAGRALPGGKLRVENEEVIYEGANVMLGYAFSRADLAKGDMTGGILHTGDRGRLDEDGFLYLQGRAGREVKLLGLRVNLDEVEAMLAVHGPTAVAARPEQMLIFCEHGDEKIFQRYRQDLASTLNLSVQAFRFRRIDKLPVTGNGKTDYARLPVEP